MPSGDDQRITRTRPLISPAVLAEEIPRDDDASQTVQRVRGQVEEIVEGRDTRVLVVVGPCSIHDVDAAREYGERLRPLADELAERLLIVMRVYFEKPRTVLGWKGMINDPDLDETFGINRGLRLARTLLNDIANIGLGAGTEFLDTTLGQFYADLISWGAIGARTAESQVHRELASGLSMPVGIKNRTDGNIQVAIDAIRSARHRHLFPSLTKDGAPAILETAGNPYCHLVLRGGTETGPNYSAASVARAIDRLRQSQLAESIMIDCSHGNSERVPDRQRDVAADVKRQIDDGNAAIRALMVESHLNPGRQDLGESLDYGVSVTDACLGFDETAELLRRFAD
ncbi:MAG: 3-deoxy-7-phosphoheptulonate synthase [Pirellulaceae bacterium]|nr:3-deoxy-7-phosphoheptulonate synthase [Pirellulaceae bacterium]